MCGWVCGVIWGVCLCKWVCACVCVFGGDLLPAFGKAAKLAVSGRGKPGPVCLHVWGLSLSWHSGRSSSSNGCFYLKFNFLKMCRLNLLLNIVVKYKQIESSSVWFSCLQPWSWLMSCIKNNLGIWSDACQYADGCWLFQDAKKKL